MAHSRPEPQRKWTAGKCQPCFSSLLGRQPPKRQQCLRGSTCPHCEINYASNFHHAGKCSLQLFGVLIARISQRLAKRQALKLIWLFFVTRRHFLENKGHGTDDSKVEWGRLPGHDVGDLFDQCLFQNQDVLTPQVTSFLASTQFFQIWSNGATPLALFMTLYQWFFLPCLHRTLHEWKTSIYIYI